MKTEFMRRAEKIAAKREGIPPEIRAMSGVGKAIVVKKKKQKKETTLLEYTIQLENVLHAFLGGMIPYTKAKDMMDRLQEARSEVFNG